MVQSRSTKSSKLTGGVSDLFFRLKMLQEMFFWRIVDHHWFIKNTQTSKRITNLSLLWPALSACLFQPPRELVLLYREANLRIILTKSIQARVNNPAQHCLRFPITSCIQPKTTSSRALRSNRPTHNQKPSRREQITAVITQTHKSNKQASPLSCPHPPRRHANT